MTILKDFYVYSTLFTDVADGAAVTNTINIQADSDFRIEKITQYTIDSQVITPIKTNEIVPRFTVQLTDTGSGRNIFDNPIRVGGLFGSGQVPFILGTPKIIAARSTLAIIVTSFDVMGNTNTIQLCFIGTKLFELGKYL
ncbi:MAG: hypothetical protein V3U02_12570 [Calditrichia bacterium]